MSPEDKKELAKEKGENFNPDRNILRTAYTWLTFTDLVMADSAYLDEFNAKVAGSTENNQKKELFSGLARHIDQLRGEGKMLSLEETMKQAHSLSLLIEQQLEVFAKCRQMTKVYGEKPVIVPTMWDPKLWNK